jgi:asparagine synthetase B (glutamine-hydrolysing)
LLNWLSVGGIIGKLSYEHDEALAHPALERMLDAVWHRGADSRGIRLAQGVALGWRGDEPSREADLPSTVVRSIMAVADTTLANTSALRDALTRAGRVVRHASSAELLAHAYDEWGDRCLAQLQGPFAVAIWDGRRRRLLLARDRAGARPLYYAMLHGHGVVFASTIRALLQDPGVSREWSPAAIDAYLAYGCVPAPLTPYERISKLEPAQCLTVEGRRFHVETYWTPEDSGRLTGGPCTADDFTATLRTVVGEQPDGAAILYSGGPASAALVACAPTRRVLTVGVDQDTRDLARAYALAQSLGSNPRLEIATPDVTGLAGDVASCLDEPSADPSLVTQLAVFRSMSGQVDRALAGHGAQALWSERAPSPTPWPVRDRFSLYTRSFAGDVHDKPVPHPTRLEGLATATCLAREAGIDLRFPHADPRMIALAHGGHSPGATALRGMTRRRQGYGEAGRRRRPEHTWLRTAVNALAPRLLLAGHFDGRGMVLPSALRQLWDEHRLGRHDHTRRFWSLLMLELWFREYVDGDGVELLVLSERGTSDDALARAA